MVKMVELQDNLSKTRAVERIYDTMRQQPDTDQRTFSQAVKDMLQQERQAVEQTDQQKDSSSIQEELTEGEQEEREEKEKRLRKNKETEEEETTTSADHIIDVKI